MMSSPKIIGIVGRSRVGKDTIAEMIIDNYPQYTIKRLSAPLKGAVKELYNFTTEQLETDLKEAIDERWDKTPRTCIVSLTNYMMDYMGVEFFTKRFYSNYDGEYVIIPDVRYEHDIDEIHKRGGIVIKVEKKDRIVSHPFENRIDGMKCDCIIKNDGTLEELQSNLTKQLVLILVS
jgi:dephospho-CoA kinase